MSNQDKNHPHELNPESPNDHRKKTQSTPQGSHKEKAVENQGQDPEEGFMQGSRSSEAKDQHNQRDKNKSAKPTDRNEGQQQPQK